MKFSPSLSTSALFHAVLWGLAGYAPASHAGRTVTEPREVQNLPRQMSAADRTAALKAANLEQECGRSRLQTREIGGLQCRLALYAYQLKQISPDSPAALTSLLDGARRAEALAKSIATYAPLTTKPGLVTDRYVAHAMACGVVGDVVTALENLPPTASDEMKNVVMRVQTGAGDAYNLPRASCDCMKVSIGRATDAGASLEDRGAIQGKLTSRGCLLDKSALDQQRGGPSGFTGNAAGVAAAASARGQLLEYAKARDIGLNRCRTKYISNGNQVSKPTKLKACACDEVNR